MEYDPVCLTTKISFAYFWDVSDQFNGEIKGHGCVVFVCFPQIGTRRTSLKSRKTYFENSSSWDVRVRNLSLSFNIKRTANGQMTGFETWFKFLSFSSFI